MRSNLLWLVAGMLIAAVAANLMGSADLDENVPKTRWEYKFVRAFSEPGQPNPSSDQDVPSRLGEQGWELVSTTAVEDIDGNTFFWLSYKRSK